jgi:hypothetical protein
MITSNPFIPDMDFRVRPPPTGCIWSPLWFNYGISWTLPVFLSLPVIPRRGIWKVSLFFLIELRSVVLGLNVNILRASMVNDSPVCGFLPLRSFFCFTSKLPKPWIYILLPVSRVDFIIDSTISNISLESFFDRSVLICMRSAISALVIIDVPPVYFYQSSTLHLRVF